MDWKSLALILLIGAGLAAAVGCNQAVVTSPATTQASEAPTAPAAQPAPSANNQLPPQNPSSNSTIPQPPSGNGTISQPPSGNFTSGKPGVPAMDLAAAAAKLGVTEQQLTDALGNMQQGMPDFATVAQKLGVTEEALLEALGVNSSNSARPSGPGGAQPPASANGTMPGGMDGAQPPTASPSATSN
jgi:hypothetical protein